METWVIFVVWLLITRQVNVLNYYFINAVKFVKYML